MQTRESLYSDLGAIGVAPGDVLMVHSSLKSLGYVLGGAATVVRALLDAVTSAGTVVMPAFSPQISDPLSWLPDSVGTEEVKLARRHVPVFDLDTTPTSMGAIPETFRRWPGVERSAHPQVSVTALGPEATTVVEDHPLVFGEGAGSPFARLYDLDAKMLLIGVGYNRATMLHYAESLVPHGRRKKRTIPFEAETGRTWVEVPDVGDDLDTHFPVIGSLVSKEGLETVGFVGDARSSLIRTRLLVDRAQEYLDGALSSA